LKQWVPAFAGTADQIFSPDAKLSEGSTMKYDVLAVSLDFVFNIK